MSDAIICATPGEASGLLTSADADEEEDFIVEEAEFAPELDPDMDEPCDPVAPLLMPGALPRCASVALGADVDGEVAEDGGEEGDEVDGELLVCAKAGAASRVVAKR